MASCIEVRGVKIGEGIPKICVPAAERKAEDILRMAERAKLAGADLVEWRADWYEDVLKPGSIEHILKEMRNVLGDIPILFTFRTRKEGGERDAEVPEYLEINYTAAGTGYVDLIDIELNSGDEYVKEAVKRLHNFEVKVIISNHDFQKTPSKQEIVNRLCKMWDLGGDIAKIAVMPVDKRDVFTLLLATQEAVSQDGRGPAVTMSMSKTGFISRLCGEVSGSAVTFGTCGNASAPGQPDAEELKQTLEMIHKNNG